MSLIVVFYSVIFSSCKQEYKRYAFVSHTRLDDNSGVNPSVLQIDLESYDVLMLGGDMAYLSSFNDEILMSLDSCFDLSNMRTLWALGNHDYTNVKLLKEYTKKERYYSYVQDNTMFIVLDTQLDSSRISGEQLNFFKALTDTEFGYDNLIVLTHKLIWMRNHSILEKQIMEVSNGHYGECSYCIQSNNFYSDIYPRLLNLKRQGVNVYCVAGDVGHHVSSFEYLTKEGVRFLATGMKLNSKRDCYLEFYNEFRKDGLSYQFISL